MASDLVRRKVAAIFAVGPPAVIAAKAATATVPIVIVSGLDPVRAGFVASLSRPGGDVTGISLITSALGGKRLELLRDLVRKAAKVVLLVNPSNPNTETQVSDVQLAARSAGIEVNVLEASSESGIDNAFATLGPLRPDALVVGADPYFTSLCAGRGAQLAGVRRAAGRGSVCSA